MEKDRSPLSIPEAARRLGVDRATLWRWVKAGRLGAFVTPGGHHRILAADLEEVIKRHRPLDAPVVRQRMNRVLVVDDDGILRELLARILSLEGYRVETAEDGFDAGIKVMAFRPDLLVLDLFMPRMNGFDVCRRLRGNARTAGIKILIYTGFASEENRALAFEAGADAVLAKPAERAVLLETLQALLTHPSLTRKGLAA